MNIQHLFTLFSARRALGAQITELVNETLPNYAAFTEEVPAARITRVLPEYDLSESPTLMLPLVLPVHRRTTPSRACMHEEDSETSYIFPAYISALVMVRHTIRQQRLRHRETDEIYMHTDRIAEFYAQCAHNVASLSQYDTMPIVRLTAKVMPRDCVIARTVSAPTEEGARFYE